jgi:hypothetical protein
MKMSIVFDKKEQVEWKKFIEQHKLDGLYEHLLKEVMCSYGIMNIKDLNKVIQMLIYDCWQSWVGQCEGSEFSEVKRVCLCCHTAYPLREEERCPECKTYGYKYIWKGITFSDENNIYEPIKEVQKPVKAVDSRPKTT